VQIQTELHVVEVEKKLVVMHTVYKDVKKLLSFTPHSNLMLMMLPYKASKTQHSYLNVRLYYNTVQAFTFLSLFSLLGALLCLKKQHLHSLRSQVHRDIEPGLHLLCRH